MRKKFNVLYWNINYRENWQGYNIDDSQKINNINLATKIIKNEIDNIIQLRKVKYQDADDDIHAIIFTEAYPLSEDNELITYLRENDYSVLPYDCNFDDFLVGINDLTTYKDENINKYIPFKRKNREIVGVKNGTKEEYLQNDYSNGVIIAVKKEFNFKLSGYKLDNPNYLAIDNGEMCLAGTRVNHGYPDMTSQFKKKLNCKALEGIKLSGVNIIGSNYVLDNKEGYTFNEEKEDKVNDYIIRRANFEYIKDKFNKAIDVSKYKKVVVIGDFNINEKFKYYPIWRYDDIVSKDNNFKICRDFTIGNSKMDYVYTNLKVDTKDFFAIRTIKEVYCNNLIQNDIEKVISSININSPFPDHNLLFASIDLGCGN